MSAKTFPLSKGRLEELSRDFPTPFYLYDEKAIRQNAKRLIAAFSVFPGYKEHFAVKALPKGALVEIDAIASISN